MGSILEPITFCIAYTRNAYLAKKEKKNSLWHSSKARISRITLRELGCVLGYTHLIFLLYMSSHLPICIATLFQKNRRLDYQPLSEKMNPPHITHDSLSRGRIKIELVRAVEIELNPLNPNIKIDILIYLIYCP